MKFLDKLKQEIRPDESVNKEVDEFIAKINSRIRKQRIRALCIKGGSLAKGTFLKGDYDVDLFVRFDYSYADADLSNLLEKALNGLKATRVHGSRDYFQIQDKKLFYEIVPVLDIKDYRKIKNITDMSLLHVNYVKKAIQKSKNIADEIRLLKRFCKAQKVYGAESYIRGFSGYVTELLIIHYGSFANLTRNASKWKDKQIIDTKKLVKDPLFELNKAKTEGPLVLIDPVQKNRNAAAALSEENCGRFRKAAKEFLQKPSDDFFQIKKIDLAELKKKFRNERLISLDVSSLKGKEDVVGSKMLKAYEFILGELKKNEFSIIESGWEWDRKEKALFYFALKKEKLSEFRKHRGPPLKNKTHVGIFRKKYKKTFSEKGAIYAKIKRRYVDAEKLVKNLLKEKYLLEKINEIKLLK